MAMDMGILWGDWIAQPLEHRVLYMVARHYRNLMGDVEEAERKAAQR